MVGHTHRTTDIQLGTQPLDMQMRLGPAGNVNLL
jgi:hypothetical protein